MLSREQLLEQVWGYDYYGDLRVVDAAVKRLRAKLREAAPGAEIIVTVRGVGYKLAVADEQRRPVTPVFCQHSQPADA